MILPFKLYAHDESSLLSTPCNHQYTTTGNITYSIVSFAFSNKNLISHGAVNLDLEKGSFQVLAELKNLTGDIENYAGKIRYIVENNEPKINMYWILTDMFDNEDEVNNLKSRIGDKPPTVCYVVL